MSGGYTLAELAERFGLIVRGDGATRVERVGTLSSAAPRRLSFLANPRYRGEIPGSNAAAVVLREADAGLWPHAALVAKDPYAAFAKIAALFETAPAREPGIHPSAVVDSTARIDPSVHVGPFVAIGARSVVQAGAAIGPGCVVGDDCTVGAESELVARVTLVTRVRLGRRVRIHPGAVIGAAGFGLAMENGAWLNVPQLGGVVIGDDCEIGANTSIDRGALEDTVLEEDVRLDNQIQIGHNVHIGAHTAMAGCSAAAGSARIGRYCLIGGAAGVLGHITVGDRVTITAMSLVTHSLSGPGEYSSGTPIQDSRSWRRNAARFKQLDATLRRLKSTPQEEEQ